MYYIAISCRIPEYFSNNSQCGNQNGQVRTLEKLFYQTYR